MKILVFDKYFGYNIGGAQKSLHLLIQSLGNRNLKILGCEINKSYNAKRTLLNSFKVERLHIKEYPKLPYLEYFVNRSTLKKTLVNFKADLLITQGLWGAVAARFFSGKKIYFIRDEYQLNRIPLYQRGVKKILKLIYLLTQLPFILIMFYDNRQAIKDADVVVANSNYIKDQIKIKFSRDSLVIYPAIERLEKIKPSEESARFITCVGSEYMKGRPIVEKIAKKMMNYKFLIVGREFQFKFTVGNITFVPWEKNVGEVYKQTKILLVPSICAEAFGRTAVEALSLGLPVIGSSRGGIPEALNEKYIVNNIWDINEWVEKINSVAQEGYEMDQVKLGLFSPDIQIRAFTNMVKEMSQNSYE